MNCPWAVRELPVGCRGLRMGSPWDDRGLPMGCSGDARGLPMDCPWDAHGISMGCPRHGEQSEIIGDNRRFIKNTNVVYIEDLHYLT